MVWGLRVCVAQSQPARRCSRLASTPRARPPASRHVTCRRCCCHRRRHLLARAAHPHPSPARAPPHAAAAALQLFNQMNARKILDSSQAWEGLGSARWFQWILGSELLLQILIVQVGRAGCGAGLGLAWGHGGDRGPPLTCAAAGAATAAPVPTSSLPAQPEPVIQGFRVSWRSTHHAHLPAGLSCCSLAASGSTPTRWMPGSGGCAWGSGPPRCCSARSCAACPTEGEPARGRQLCGRWRWCRCDLVLPGPLRAWCSLCRH